MAPLQAYKQGLLSSFVLNWGVKMKLQTITIYEQMLDRKSVV